MKKLILLVSHLAVALVLATPSVLAQSHFEADIGRLVFEPVLLLSDVQAPAPQAGNNSPAMQTALIEPNDEAGDEAEGETGDEAADESPEPPRLLSSLASYRDNIESQISADGPFAEGLTQDYFALGNIYQSLNQHEEAIEAFAEADYISRINKGLATKASLDLLEAEIESHLAMGDFSAANNRQQHLFYLAQEVHGKSSLEMVPLLSQLADRNMEHFGIAIHSKSQPAVRISTGGSDRGATFNSRALAFGNLSRAQHYYSQAIGNLITHRQFANPELLQLENKLLEAIFLSANRNGFMNDPEFYLSGKRRITGTRILGNELSGFSTSFINGRNVYVRKLMYLRYLGQRVSTLDLAAEMVGQADWYLLYQHHAQALKLYRQARAFMQANNIPADSIRQLLNPALPVQLPAFTPLPHSRARYGVPETADLEHDGYIDVGFELSRYGQVRNLNILGKSESASDVVVNRLKRLLRSSPFRPFYHESQEAGDDSVRLRYHFSMLENSQLAGR